MRKVPLVLAGVASLMAFVSARATTAQPPPSSVDEPSILGLLAAGTVAGVLAWRSRRGR